MISLAQVIGSNSISAIQFQDNEFAKGILSDLKKVSPEVINAAILDKQKNVFAKYTKPGTDSFRFTLPASNNNTFEYDVRQLLVYNTIINKKDTLGTVCLRVELSELDKIKRTQYNIAIVLLIVGVGLSTLIAFIVQRYISKRLLSLVSIMNQVGKHRTAKRIESHIRRNSTAIGIGMSFFLFFRSLISIS